MKIFALIILAITTTLEFEDAREAETRAAVSNDIHAVQIKLAGDLASATNDLAQALGDAIAAAEPGDYATVSNRAMTAMQSYIETDPTVPAWAKSETPPVTVESDPVFTNWTANSYVELGNGASASHDHNSVAIGPAANATSGNSVAIGRSAAIKSIREDQSEIDQSMIDFYKEFMWTANTAIGYGAEVTTDWANPDTRVPTQMSTALGASAKVTMPFSVAIGPHAHATEDEAVAIGKDSVASNYMAVVIGPYAVSHGSNTVNLHADAIDKVYLADRTLKDLIREYVNDALAATNITTSATINRKPLLLAAAQNVSLSAADVGAIEAETDPVWNAASTNYYTKAEADDAISEAAPTIPENISAFTNDVGYATEEYVSDELDAMELWINRNLSATEGIATGASRTAIQAHTAATNAQATATAAGAAAATALAQIATNRVQIATNMYTIAANSVQIATNAVRIAELATGKQDAISDLETIRSGAALGATALQSYTETDPTVSSWAKADNKPTYAYSEITGTPTAISAFTNDAGYLTEHQSLTNYYTKAQVDAAISNAVAAAVAAINYDYFMRVNPSTGAVYYTTPEESANNSNDEQEAE